MNIKQYFSGMLVVLAVLAAGATPSSPSLQEEEEQVVVDSIQPSYVTKTEFDSLKVEVKLLSDNYENNEESNSGSGFGSVLLSLIFGIIGGAATVLAINKYAAGKQKKNTDTGVKETIQKKPKEESNTEESQQQKAPSPGLDPTKKNTHNQQENQRQEAKRSSYSLSENKKVNAVKVPIKETTKLQDVMKRLYANIMIPSKGMLIIPDYSFSESDNDVDFQFDLSETRGIGTYTIAPAILKDGISRLSVLEQYVEPFEFNSSARQINVEKAGTVIHVSGEGYWRVESKMIISLS